LFLKGVLGGTPKKREIKHPGTQISRSKGVWMDPLAHAKGIIRAPLGAAIPRFPTDGIGVPGLAKERGHKRKERKGKEKKRKENIT
jgi:hypothetical protein